MFVAEILMLNLHDATLHHEIGDSVELGIRFNTAPCFMVGLNCYIVWIDLKQALNVSYDIWPKSTIIG